MQNKINLEQLNKPFVSVIIGDVINALKLLPDGCVDCVVTSPPYWKQRDYGVEMQIGQEEKVEDYIRKLVDVFEEVKRVLKPTGTFFLNIGYKYLNKELILVPELLAIELQKSGWSLLNKIIWAKPNAMPTSIKTRFGNVYEPIFLFVKRESKYAYYIDIDSLREPFQTSKSNDILPDKYLNMKVYDSLNKKGKREGFIDKIFENGKRLIARILWNDGDLSYELINNPNNESQVDTPLFCPVCNSKIRTITEYKEHEKCENFPLPLLPHLPAKNILSETKIDYLFPELESLGKNSKNNYKGKFTVSPENRGASPGARKSLFGEYFIVQRRYKIFQPVVAKYLRYWKQKRGFTIKQIDKEFGYKDTASHWFRTDYGSWGKGGSIPSPSDWWKLKRLLNFDDTYDQWLTETHLVLQTVRPYPKGKNPGDLWEINLQPVTEAHFATFPEELVRRCILAGCPQGGVVLDPFAGSGTTGKVALENFRSAILIDIVPDYLEIMKRRCGKIQKVFYA